MTCTAVYRLLTASYAEARGQARMVYEWYASSVPFPPTVRAVE